jgi:hypothetical protein
VFISVAGSILIIASVGWWFRANTQIDQAEVLSGDSIEQPISESQVSPETEKTNDSFDSQKLQQILEQWGASVSDTSSRASVVIKDQKGKELASIDKDASFFSASLYKLFVAYEGYRQIDGGSVSAEESYLAGRNRVECLDAMIRSSDSPCAEKMWVELGKQNLTEKMSSYGMKNTSLVNLTTSAEDVASLLALFLDAEEMSLSSQGLFLSSMKEQEARYRRGLPSGFSDKVSAVYNKVGWNEQLEWHDAAIIELPDGQKVVVTVLTSGVGTKKIIELAQELEVAMLQQ